MYQTKKDMHGILMVTRRRKPLSADVHIDMTRQQEREFFLVHPLLKNIKQNSTIIGDGEAYLTDGLQTDAFNHVAESLITINL